MNKAWYESDKYSFFKSQRPPLLQKQQLGKALTILNTCLNSYVLLNWYNADRMSQSLVINCQSRTVTLLSLYYYKISVFNGTYQMCL